MLRQAYFGRVSCDRPPQLYIVRMQNSGIPATCTHTRRPGTTVCLYCLEEARAHARRQRNRALRRAGLLTLGGGVGLSLIIGAASALRTNAFTTASNDGVAVEQTGDTTSAAAPSRERGPLPIISEGRTQLGDSMVAERRGDTVIVNFDTELLRTRFDWKFEGVIRATLGMVYGEPVRRALDSIPQGDFVRGDILDRLARRGVELELPDDAGSLRIWPMTRPGRDGPIAVSYRVLPER